VLKVTFPYYINDILYEVTASCRNITEAEDVEGLTLEIKNEDETLVKIPYDKDLFEDLELEAMHFLAEEYYNPQLDFSNTKTH